MTNWFSSDTIYGAARKALQFKERYNLTAKPTVKKLDGIWLASIEG